MDNKRDLIVVKFGSDAISKKGSKSTGISQRRVNEIARSLRRLHGKYDLAVITSGAVAQGRRRLEDEFSEPAMGYEKQTLAMFGNASISRAWEEAFQAVEIKAGGVLVTHKELRDTSEGPAFHKAMERVRKYHAVAIINHQDFLSDPEDIEDEIKELENYADNDRLAKDVAIALGAEGLVLATNGVEGFKDMTGKVRRIIRIDEITGLKDHIYEATENGTGGMGSKLDNLAEAVQQGLTGYICSSDADFIGVLSGIETSTRVIQ